MVTLELPDDSLKTLRETMEVSRSYIEGHGCCQLDEESIAEAESAVATLDRVIAEIDRQTEEQ